MNLNTNIKSLRKKNHVTQEELADAMGVSFQAVSKWENGVTMPDIELLPKLSVFFGVTIDELFEISEEDRLKRIGSMLENECFISDELYKQNEEYLTTIVQQNGRNTAQAYYLLTYLNNRMSDRYKEKAKECGRKCLTYDANNKTYEWQYGLAVQASSGDWYADRHTEAIKGYYEILKEDPKAYRIYMCLIENLIEDYRLEEAEKMNEELRKLFPSFHSDLYAADITFKRGNYDKAKELWAKLLEENIDDWRIHFTYAERMYVLGEYDEALREYQKAYDMQDSPKYTDALEAMNIIYEIRGEHQKIVDNCNEILRTLRDDYSITDGQNVERIKREINAHSIKA